jgi:RTX calcium-binding nonapeptide repeat (4 copies)
VSNGVAPVSCSTQPTLANTAEIHIDGSAGDETVIFVDPAALIRTNGTEVFSTVDLKGQSFGGDSLGLVASDSGSSFRFGVTGSAAGINTNADEATGDMDIVYLGQESVRASGGAGVDTFSAAGGAGTGSPLDTPIAFEGGGGADVITGSPFGDSLTGDDGADSLSGGDGDDLLDGSAGDDLIEGDAGSDTFRSQTAATGLTLDLAVAGPQNTVAAGLDTVNSVENALGTSDADRLFGDAGPNELRSLAGNDMLDGRGGVDRLSAEFQNDTIVARDGGPDFVNCGDGTDSVAADLAGTDALIDCESVAFGAPGPILPGPGPGPGPAPDTTAPVFAGRVRAVPNEFVVNRRGAAETPVRAGARRGTSFRYVLSEAATVTFAIKRRVRGRRVGGKCRRQTARNRTRRPCIRLVRSGAFQKASVAGPNRKRFSGRIGKRALRPGAYVALVSARDAAGNVSKRTRARFTVLRAG